MNESEHDFDRGAGIETGEQASPGPVPKANQPPPIPPAKRGPGRPRKDSGATAQKQVGSAGRSVAAAPQVDPALIRDTASRMLSILSDATYRRTFRLAAYATGNDAQAETLAEEARLSEEERETLADLSVTLAEKYGAAVQYMPEIAAGLCLGGWLWRSSRLNSRLAELIKAKQAAAPGHEDKYKP